MPEPRTFPLQFSPYTFPDDYMGQGPSCQTDCCYCNRTEAYWRQDDSNTVNKGSLDGITALVGVEWPKGTGTIPFADDAAAANSTMITLFMIMANPD